MRKILLSCTQDLYAALESSDSRAFFLPSLDYGNGDKVQYTYDQQGRQLASLTEGTDTWNYSYNSAGLRTGRTDGTTNYTYVYDGSRLMVVQKDDVLMRMSYDSTGPLSLIYNGATYRYEVNIQGDVIALLDTEGNVVVEYTYDAWGNPLTITGDLADTVGVNNPLRYRGYVYDTETGLYYLQSRYYDPELGRFLNADAFAATGQGILGNNTFAYCLNNPVNRIDTSGTTSLWYYLMVDSDWGFIHRMVQQHIAATQGQNMVFEITVYGRGRADIVDTLIGAVWEIKHAGSMPAARCAEAIAQASKYLGGECKDKLVINTLGNAGKFSGTFCISVGDTNYEINYYTPQNGAVLYTVKETSKGTEAYAYAYKYVRHEEKETSLETGVVITAVGAPIAIPMGSGGGFMGDPRTVFQFF